MARGPRGAGVIVLRERATCPDPAVLLTRVAALLLLALPLTACGTPEDRCPVYAEIQAGQAGEASTLNHVCARPPPPTPPLLSERGDMWPVAAQVPTVLDLRGQTTKPAAPAHEAAWRTRAKALCQAKPGTTPKGVALGLCPTKTR